MDAFRILTKREKIILCGAAGTVLLALCVNFILAPFLERNDALNKDIGAARGKIRYYVRLLKQKNIIQNRYRELSSLLGEATNDPGGDALSEIENFARAAKVKIIEVRPQEYHRTTKGKEKEIEMRAEAALEGYVKFMYELENSLSLLRVKSFQMTPRQGSHTIEAIFQLSEVEI